MELQVSSTKRVVEPEDIVALYLQSHTRLRAFTVLAAGLARVQGAKPELIVSTAQRLYEYFTTVLPLHFRDEEESLARRLRGTDPAVDRALDEMEAQHREH
ncbi:MAG: Hemerythrin cation binding domain protein, partial [Myxococcaceae bacterium]|nr:Hemerythrin cation binding domain protein [Myxococcaceae bacterium]